ncbi:MAG: hypothetical protein ACRDDX_02105 [Cellulosilyticaceae bacterium]
MNVLFEQLEAIKETLEQIHVITQNQMTILLETQYIGEGLDMIEQMADYKETLTTEVEKSEAVFQELYTAHKHEIQQPEDKKRLKQLVDEIMRWKTVIMEGEQKNIMVMRDLLRRCTEKVELPKNAQQVASAYKAHNKK